MRDIDHGFEVAHHGVDPAELGQRTGAVCACDDVGASAARVNVAGKAAQALAAFVATWPDVVLGPVGDVLPAETGQARNLHARRMPCIAHADSRNDGHLVRRTTATHQGTHAANVGGIEQDAAAQRLLTDALGLARPQFVVGQLCSAGAVAKRAFECQYDRPVLCRLNIGTVVSPL